MDSYEAHLPISRQTTGLSFVTSVCIHALLLCALLLSYHVQSLLLTRQLKQAVPTAQGLDRSTVIFKSPQAQSGTAQNQASAQQQQQQQTKAATNNQAQQAADAATAQEPSSEQNKQNSQTHTSTVSKTETTEPLQEETDPQEDAAEQEDQEPAKTSQADQKVTRPTTSIVKTDARLELPLSQQTDSIPIQRASDTHLQTNNQARDVHSTRTRRQPATADQSSKTPWYRTQVSDRNYAQASAAKPVQKITLQDVTRGFFKSVQQEKRKTAESNNQLSTHDMVSKSYETKVYNMLQKSVLVEAKPIAMHHALSTVAEIALTIDRTGKILSFEFNHPLPKQALKAVEDQLRRAAYSTGLYPSFPRIFTQNTYRFSLPLHIEITKGQHSYRLTTNYRPL